MSPKEFLNLEILGNIVTEDLTLSEGTVLSGSSYEVIEILEDIYVCNEWYNEAERKPQLVPKFLVKKFNKIA
jgi:hypothetical protein